MNAEINKIIAEFLGWEINNELWINDKKVFVQYTDQSLKFHSDWNRLMEVVEKIESLIKEIPSLSFQITNNHISVIVNATPLYADIRQFSSLSKKESVYNACVEFIKWYNQQK